MTDHGYAGLEVDATGRPRIGLEMHSERGLWVVAGPRVVPGSRAEAALFDAAPTIMAAAGIPVPDDLDGIVRREMLRE